MSVESVLREAINKVDESDRRTGRAALRHMVRTGQIREGDLLRVVAPRREVRMLIRHLTVQDLIDMGIVTVVEDVHDEAVA